MRVLVVTRLFPNAKDPFFSPFNRQQFAALGKRCQVDVLASIPWFPGARLFARWSAAGRLVGVPRQEWIEGLPVVHPRYLHLPRIGHAVAGALYAASLAREALRRRGRYDVLLGSWAFPDGVGAVALARLLGVPALCDADAAALETARAGLPERLYRRARHVISENARTLKAVESMRRGDSVELGHLMNASHTSLRDDFEVSSDSLNAIVECALQREECYGARMTGAGFGGCAVALVRFSGAESFAEGVATAYRGVTGLAPQVYICKATNGAEVVMRQE